MPKLQLRVESLTVQSFHPRDDDPRHGGTVFGRADVDTNTTRTDPRTGPTCPECPISYPETCYTCYGDSCQVICGDPRFTDNKTCRGDSCDICYAPTSYTC
ncbi:MAG TPA: hypothetical protein VF665_20870 [Longimicrobium sp.]|jgi:hypothetical protein|uniref:hypothetical protein n=1 Tax=Longimicrobium sp. TaxID=2029185 RepID=UPI002ED963EA